MPSALSEPASEPTAAERDLWFGRRLDPALAAAWSVITDSPAEALRMADEFGDAGFRTVEAAKWARLGFSPARAREFCDAGYDDPAYAANARDNGYFPKRAA